MVDILLGFVRLVEGIIVALFAYRAEAWCKKRCPRASPTGGIGLLVGLLVATFSLGALEYLIGVADIGPSWPFVLGSTNVIAFQSGIERGRRSHA